jgi:hypothetical protein
MDTPDNRLSERPLEQNPGRKMTGVKRFTRVLVVIVVLGLLVFIYFKFFFLFGDGV